MMANKLKKIILALSASMVITLAGCDDIEARLPNETDPILTNLNGEVYHNELKEIYDALITAGSSNSERVLNQILLKIAYAKFGHFYDVTDEAGAVTEKGLVTVMEEAATEGDTVLDTFIASHEIYKTNDEDGKYSPELSRQRLVSFYDQLIEIIQKALWSIVNNTSYQERSYFREELFHSAMAAELYHLGTVADYKETMIYGEFNYEETPRFFTDYLVTYEDYIDRAILESAFRKALVEQYILNKNYGALGRSYARKVQIIGLKDIDDQYGATYKLVRNYASLVINATDDATLASNLGLSEDDASAIKEYLRDLRFLDTLYKGFPVDEGYYAEILGNSTELAALKTAADKIYSASGFTSYFTSYEETSYGKLVKDYFDLSTDRWTTGSTTDFTGGNSYTSEVGFVIKTREIQTNSNITEGWYTSSTMSALSSSFKNRLFKMGVANEVDTDDAEATYTRKIGNEYYLMPESYQASNATPYCLYDSDSSTWYIVRIDEAVKASKLVVGGPNSYDKMEGREGKESQFEIALTLAYMLAESETYTKAANQSYVEEAAIAFHDQAVYDYFKSVFPDLFD